MSDDKKIKYEKYYTLFLKEDVDKYLSYSSFFWKWGYLYKNPKPLWFTKVDGDSEGRVKTGDLLYIKALVVGKHWLKATGEDRTAYWGLVGGDALRWRIWQNTNQEKGLDIHLGDTIVFTNERYGSRLYLAQQPGHATYVGISSDKHPSMWKIRDSDGKMPKEDREEIAALPQPPSAAAEMEDGEPPNDPRDAPPVDS